MSVNLVDTIEGIRFINLDRIPYLTLDNTYAPGENMWPTVVDKTKSQDWGKFFNYIIAPVVSGGINSPSVFDLSGQVITSQEQASQLKDALNHLTQSHKAVIEKLIIRVNAGAVIDFNDIDVTGFSHGSLQIIIDRLAGSTSAVTVPADWAAKTKEYSRLEDVEKTESASWAKYLNYRFATVDDKGEAATSLDLSSIALNADEWTALMDALNSFDAVADIQSMHLKLTAGDAYAAPAFTTANLSAATSIIVDVTGVKNAGSQVNVTGLPALISQQRVISDAAVDRSSAASWQGYMEHLLSSISGTEYTLDLTAANLRLQTTIELGHLNTALAALSNANKAKIQTIKLKVEAGNRGDFEFDSDLNGFDNLESFVVDATGVLNGTAQAAMTFNIQNTPASLEYVAAHVTALASVDLDSQDSWDYYFAHRLATAGVGLDYLDLSAVEFTAQADITAFLTSLHGQSGVNKATVQSIKLKLASDYAEGSVNLGAAEASGFTHASFAVEIDRNGANAAAPVSIAFAAVANGITAANTTVRDTAYTGLGAFDRSNAHQWLGYVRTVLSAVSGVTTTLDLSTHGVLAMNSAAVAAFVTAMNALPDVDKAKVETLKVKLASGDFEAASANFSTLDGFTALTDLIVERNGARGAANVTAAPVSIAGPGTITINDPEVRTFADVEHTNNWLGYLRFVLNGMEGAENTVDLSAFAISNNDAATAFNNALQALSAADKAKVETLKVSASTNVTLGTGSSGFAALDRIEYVKPAAHTVTFEGELAGKRTYITDLASVKMDVSSDWTAYLNYMLSTDNGGQSATSLNLNSVEFANQDQLNAFFAGLDALDGFEKANKNVLTTLRIKLADGFDNASIGRVDNTPTAASGLDAALRVVVDPGTSTGTTHAGGNVDEVQADNLIVLASAAALSRDHIAHQVEQGGFAGTVDLSASTLDNQGAATALIADLNSLPADMKAAIKTINLKLVNGNFGSSALTLDELIGFAGVTFNIDRNGAVDGVNAYGALVTVTNDTTHTVNLTDAEFHDMSIFDNGSSAHWIGYLTHELNSAPAGYTLDLTVHSALMLDSVNAVSAFSSALRYLPDSLKAKVAVLKVKSSTNGDFVATDWNGPDLGFGLTERVIPEYAAFDNLASVVFEYTATGLNMGAYVGHLENTNKYAYITTPFAGMVDADWTKFFNYQLNAANIGGLAATSVTVPGRLYTSADLATDEIGDMLIGLNSATQKASLANLTFDLASAVAGDISVGVDGLDALTSVTINTNGSAAKLTPTNSFVGKTSFTSISNVKADSNASWAAYLAGNDITNIDIREVELANQAEVTAFLTALDGAASKADVASIKMKLAAGYAGAVDFSVNLGSGAISGLDALSDNNVEIHRNGSDATATQGGSITDAKIKIVDLTADSLTDRNSAASWRRYLTSVVEANPGALDLSTDSDTYLRENTHVTAFMDGLNQLSPANKLLVTGVTVKLATGAGWDNITDLGQGLSGFTNLASFVVDATSAYTAAANNPQVTVAFHGDIAGVTTKKAIVTDLTAVDKTSTDSWEYYLNYVTKDGAAALDLSAVTLSRDELGELDTALNAFSSVVGNDNKLSGIHLKVSGAANAASVALTADLSAQSAINAGNPVIVDIAGFVHDGNQATVTGTHVQLRVSDAAQLYRQSADSWAGYLNHLYPDGIDVNTTLNLASDSNLYLRSQADVDALMAAINAHADKANITTLNVRLAPGNVGSDIVFSPSGWAPTTLNVIATGATNNGMLIETSDVHYGGAVNVTQDFRSSMDLTGALDDAEWTKYLNYLLTPTSEGGLGHNAVVVDYASTQGMAVPELLLSNADRLTALMTALAALDPAVKASLTHLYLDVSELADALELGTGVTGFDNLQSVYYVRAADATAAVGSSFNSKLQRLRTALSLDSATEIEEYLHYVLIDAVMGGAEQTVVDLTEIALTSTDVGYLNTALGALPADLKSRITELRLNLSLPGSPANDVTFNAEGLSNLSVKYFQDGDGVITWNNSFANAKKTRFRADIVDVDPTSESQWAEYLAYQLTPVAEGGVWADATITLAINHNFDNQAQIYALFDAMQALDSGLKAQVQRIHINIAGITTGNVSLARTDNEALTGFSALEAVTYDRGAGLETDMPQLVSDLTTELNTALNALDEVWPYPGNGELATAIDTAVGDASVTDAIAAFNEGDLKTAVVAQLAAGVVLPDADVFDADVDDAAAAVSVMVDGVARNSLETALTPFRSTGKITGINTAITNAMTKGTTTGLGTLPWLKDAWGAYANHDAVIAAVLADGAVRAEIERHDSTIADIKTAVTTKLREMIIPTQASLTGFVDSINFTEVADWANNVNDFKTALATTLGTDMATAYPQYVTDGTNYITTLVTAAMDGWTLDNDATGRDTNNSGQALKDALVIRLETQVNDHLTIGAGTLDTAIDNAFTAADSGNALTDGTTAWVRPTGDIESDLTTSITGALNGADWYTGTAADDAADAVAAGDVANQNAATIISNIKAWLTANITRPTASSLFEIPVNTAVDAINLANAQMAVTPNFTGASGGGDITSANRYRTDIADVDPTSQSQWAEYLAYQLAPAAEGGAGATTLDITSITLDYGASGAKLTAFVAALNSMNAGAITQIKLKVSGYTTNAISLNGDGGTYHNNLKVIVYTDAAHTGAINHTHMGNNGVLHQYLEAVPAVSAGSFAWQRYLNYQLSGAAIGGNAQTAVDLSDIGFTSQTELNTFFAALNALNGDNGWANKNALQNLTLKLTDGNFGAASAHIGYTGSAAVTGLKGDINVTVHRNGARNGANAYDPIVTVDHSNIDAISSVYGSTVDNPDAAAPIRNSSASWLAYLTHTISDAAFAPGGNDGVLDLTGADFQLQAGSSVAQAAALMNALQALDSSLKAKIESIKIKLAAGNHGAGALAISGTLTAAAGFTNLATVTVDVVGAKNGNVAYFQKTVDLSGLAIEVIAVKEVHISSVADIALISPTTDPDALKADIDSEVVNLDSAAADIASALTAVGQEDAGAATTAIADADGRIQWVKVVLEGLDPADLAALGISTDIANAIAALTSAIADLGGAANEVGSANWVNAQSLLDSVETSCAQALATLNAVSANLTIASDNLTSSWGYYLNWLATQPGGIASIDLSALDLFEDNELTTQANVDAFFTALNARSDKGTVKDIFLDISGASTGQTYTIGSGVLLSGLTSVVILKDAGQTPTINADTTAVQATDLAVINSATNEAGGGAADLGAEGTVAQWKGYLAHLLEDEDHGGGGGGVGAYAGSPIALDLTAADLQIADADVLGNLEQAIAELPARLKARISAIVIKTLDDESDLSSNAFGDGLDTTIAEFTELRAVVIDASATTTGGNKPVFPGAGAFHDAATISKIVY